MLSNKYKIVVYCLFLTGLLVGCSKTKLQDIKEVDGFAVLPAAKEGERVANFAGGCFWAMQECLIQLKGVNQVISGYAGGETTNPNYDAVLTGTTGHAEAVQVYYDPKVISFAQLTKAFFLAHDPTQLNRQGPDVGTDYRSIAFYRNNHEYRQVMQAMDTVQASGIYRNIPVTEVRAFKVFYPAEMAHQDYYKRNGWDIYIRKVSRPKVLKVQKSIPSMIKAEYLE
jgi:peptide-methionine (S)-S-oxide reductase